MKLSIDFWEFLEKTNNAQTEEELFNCLEDFSSQLGLDRILYSLMTDHPSLNRKAGHGVLRSYPEDWMKYYFEKGYEHTDPVRQYIWTKPSSAFCWDDIERSYSLPAQQKRILDEGKEAKLLDGIAVPLYSAGGEIAGMGFASSSGGVELDKNLLSMIHAIAHQFNLAYRRLICLENGIQHTKISLTKREKEVLIWVADGKNNWEIGAILSISEHGVDFHLRNIFKKLNVKSRISAVVKGIRQNLITPV